MSNLPTVTPVTVCSHCPPKSARLNLNHNHHPGFGYTRLTCDGKCVGQDDFHGTIRSSGRFIERRAAKDPDHDWRFYVEGPMRRMVYQRQGEKTWHCVETGIGFA